jgi:crotonobetainyl-CoA:carnitine CoA-transferase CaiB-like acyl-CoA transferase
MSETPLVAYTSPPTLGQHTYEILREVLGMELGAIRHLEQTGVL